jgi:hypothetical protein
MAAIHLASCDLVAFLRTFDRLQRTLFLHQSFHFSNHEHWLESGSNRPTPARQCIPCLEKMFSTSYASNLVFRCLYPLNVKVESALFAARPLMRGARQLAVAVAVRRLVSVRRRGNLSATFMAMTESAAQSLHHRIFPPLSPANMQSIRRMTLPSIDLTSAHLSYLILSMFIVSYSLFCELIHSRLYFTSRMPAGHARRHSSLVSGGTVSLIRTDGGLGRRHPQEVAWVVVGLQVFALPLSFPQKYLKVNLKYRNTTRPGHGY